MYLTVSVADVQGVIPVAEVSVLRPVKVFTTTSPDDEPSEWVSAKVHNLSLLARSGVPLLVKALHDDRSVRSDKGRGRYGFFEKDDGTQVPRFHGSEVALIAFAVQEVLIERGVLGVYGNPVPSRVRAKKAAQMQEDQGGHETLCKGENKVQAGKECKDCRRAHVVIKKDGCDLCTNCGTVGSCA